MTVDAWTIDEIWNSKDMRSIRKRMVEGKRVPACSVCDTMEAQSESSYRGLANKRWSEMIGSFQQLIESSKADSFRVTQAPRSFHLTLGNACNLKCRMCNPLFSNRVESDAVQSKWWAPARLFDPEVLQWKEGRTIVGPEQKTGVVSTGFHSTEIFQNRCLRWTKGHASLSFRVPSHLTPEKLAVKLWGFQPAGRGRLRRLLARTGVKGLRDRRLRLSLNEHLLYDGKVPVTNLLAEFDISSLAGVGDGPLKLAIDSDIYLALKDVRRLGIAVEQVDLVCSHSGKARLKSGHEAEGLKPWFERTDWIFDELLANPQELLELYFSGGEPLISKRFEEILDFCIDRRVAENITLQLNTNCTVLPQKLLDKMKRFKQLFLALSVDAYGKYWEYIRYPGRWANVDENIRSYKALPNSRIMMVPVLQNYNIFNILDLVSYCERMGMECYMYPLTDPWYLSVSTLPASVRQKAADDFLAYADGDHPHDICVHLKNMAKYLQTVPDDPHPEALRTFMLFTNDLDRTRGQSFRETHGELYVAIEAGGFRWTDETRHAQSSPPPG